MTPQERTEHFEQQLVMSSACISMMEDHGKECERALKGKKVTDVISTKGKMSMDDYRDMMRGGRK